VFDITVMRIFAPKRNEVTSGWSKLHNDELCHFYSSPNIITMFKLRRMRWVRHVAQMGEKMNAYRSLVGKPEGKRPLGKPRRRWVHNVKMDLGEIGLGGGAVLTGFVWLRIAASGGLL
jgi:hypothetical protein